MDQEFTEEQLAEIARQLNKPEGPIGLEVAANMNQTNISMTRAAIHSLDWRSGKKVLELGHGNCGHLSEVLQQADELTYVGLEISQSMQEEARRINREEVDKGRAQFHLYDGQKIPFEDGVFDLLLTVNTIYFWADPLALLEELARVASGEAHFAIAFAHKDFMEKLLFVKDNFRLYDQEDVRQLVDKSPWQLQNIATHTEQVTSKSGALVERIFSIASLEKQ
ncbi:MAG: class I SAM-dependent methyltransferase [Bacteroidota bacterium]